MLRNSNETTFVTNERCCMDCGTPIRVGCSCGRRPVRNRRQTPLGLPEMTFRTEQPTEQRVVNSVRNVGSRRSVPPRGIGIPEMDFSDVQMTAPQPVNNCGRKELATAGYASGCLGLPEMEF